jgi:hypothetical protein
MDSLQYGSIVVVFCVLLVGCTAPSAPSSPSTTVSGDTITLQPGESETANVEATNVVRMRFGFPRRASGVDFAIRDATVEPSPDFVAESYPPVWNWNSPRASVTVDVPVSVAANATAGTYHYPVTVWNDSVQGDAVTGNVTVIIET